VIGRLINLIVALLVTAALVDVAARGAGPLPALGPALVPGTGIWTAAADAQQPTHTTLHLAGLQAPVQVVFEKNGNAHIRASNDHDLFLAMGYVHARYRLLQMDLERRQGEGLLSQIVGSQALASDRFELRLGLIRTARANLAAVDATSRSVLTAYAQGVNDRITWDRAHQTLPLLFHLLGYEPAPWTPLDTFVIQGDVAQTLDFTKEPLDYAVLTHSLGYQRAMQWFGVLPPNAQHPYDSGPYGKRQHLSPLTSQLAPPKADQQVVSQLLNSLDSLPAGAVHQGSNSNNWAVNGPKTASGKALMAGDPHLNQTLPAIWYELSLDDPSQHAAGVSIPGTPAILIGHNRDISWSETNTQNQATFYYLEHTSTAHPHQYFWRGAWRKMGKIQYAIPLKGGGTSSLTVWTTVHGPIIDSSHVPGATIAVNWMGNHISPDLEALQSVAHARNWGQFKSALAAWHAPSQNFIYADRAGNIGLIAAGYYPQIRHGVPWLPLPGNGSADITGTIPYSQVPQVYDPKDHLVFSANQRPVGSAYPYYIGTTLDDFDTGYRADRIWQVLHNSRGLTAADMERLQLDVHDYLAQRMVPKLLASLRGAHLDARQRAAVGLLQNWNGAMRASSPAAAIWWSFWDHYVHATFDPWWRSAHVPSKRFASLRVDATNASLEEDLEHWTLTDPGNAVFAPPDAARGTASSVMRTAFAAAVASLTGVLGNDPSAWTWGRLHTRQFPSLAQIPSLGYGPRASSGDRMTVDAANGGLNSTSGPSWRFVMDWGSGKGVGIYPGGQSENPVSPWYENDVALWWNGTYRPILDYDAARTAKGRSTWSFLP
jgi:penicillin G amidase